MDDAVTAFEVTVGSVVSAALASVVRDDSDVPEKYTIRITKYKNAKNYYFH